MKNNYSIAERNRIVEENLPVIDKVIRRNWSLMIAAHLDYDDVYQDLAVRLIRCVENYDPDKGKLYAHIYSQLKYELLNRGLWKRSRKPCRSRSGRKKILNRSEKKREYPSRHSLVPIKNVLMITNHSIMEQT